MIDKQFVLSVLNKTLGFPIVDIPRIGKVAKLSAREAFLYSTLTAHGYLDTSEPENRFFLKRDYYRVFNQAEEFELQEGLMSISDLSFSCTPTINIVDKPYIRGGSKYILPIEYTKYASFLGQLDKVSAYLKGKSGKSPHDFVIVPIRAGQSKVSEFEAFFEYIISFYFSKLGYFSDTQIPFYYAVGTPDAAIYDIPKLRAALKKNGLGQKGYSLIELMTITTFGLDTFVASENSDLVDSAVFEVKTLQKSAPQIKKYIETGIFNKAFEVIPFKGYGEDYAGLISFKQDGSMVVIEENSKQRINKDKQSRYLEWLDIYIKFYLLANLKTEELETVSRAHKFSLNKKGLISFLKGTDYDSLIKMIIKYGKN